MLFRKLWRTMLQYRSQFISMIIMIMLGIGVFVGMKMEWYSLEKNMNWFFEETGYADYRIVSEKGFSSKQTDEIGQIEGVSAVSRYLSVNVDVKEQEGDTAALTVTENPEVSGFYLKDGEPYDSESTDGIWLSEKYAKANGISAGDPLTFAYSGMTLNGTVRGLIQSGEYMICVRDESQLMPDPDTHGYAYISPALFKEAVGFLYYPQLHVQSGLSADAFTEAADSVLGSTELIFTKDETISYAEAEGEAQEGKTMGTVLPVVFLLIALLTMVTTMHRLTLKERIQIGTLKALGFKDRQITRHYTSYAFMVGIAGTVPGIGLGALIAWFIMNENGAMGTYLDMPRWNLYIPWFCWLVMCIVLILLTLTGYLSVKQLLVGNAADTLRNDPSARQKNLRIEKTRWFHTLSFGTRWNMRDMARHKSRTAMSLIGVVGCTIIILAAFGMRDTMDAFLNSYFSEAAIYTSRIYLSENISDRQIAKLTELYGTDTSESISIQAGEQAASLDIYELKNDLVRFQSSGGVISLPGEGAYVSTRIADRMHLKAGDKVTVYPYGTSESWELEIAGIIRSLTESFVISREYAESLGIEYTPDSLYTTTEKSDITEEAGINTIQSKQMILDSFDSFTEIMNMMIAVLILAGVILGIVVLYNLGVMSYTERSREMATLKVLGFKDRRIRSLLTGQNMWVSALGVILGIPAGFGVLAYLLKALATEYELKMVIYPVSCGITILITFGVSWLVSLMTARKNKQIDMVEALKSAE